MPPFAEDPRKADQEGHSQESETLPMQTWKEAWYASPGPGGVPPRALGGAGLAGILVHMAPVRGAELALQVFGSLRIPARFSGYFPSRREISLSYRVRWEHFFAF